VGPDFEEMVTVDPLHIEIPSKIALQRRIADIDKEAAFVWFSGESEAPKRGSVMVYLPDAFNPTALRRGKLSHRGKLRGSGAFYVGFSQGEISSEPAMLRGISRSELIHLEKNGLALIDNLLPLRG
jgi:hypothetical protein